MFRPDTGLTLPNAEKALAAGLHAIGAGETSFDLLAVTEIDSAAIAILLAWVRAAKQKGVTLTWYNPSPALHSLAKLYGVHAILNLKSEPPTHEYEAPQ